jgi:hypothetical protein
MRSVMIAALVVCAAGCAEKAIELRLLAPTGDDADMDVSCVTTVQVLLHNGAFDFDQIPSQCITVDSPSSLADLQAQIRGKFAKELPDDLIAIEVRAMTNVNPAYCSDGIDIAYAGENFTGQDEINLRFRGVTNCSALATTATTKVRAVDFLSLATTPVGTPLACEPVEGLDTTGLEIGMIRPTDILLPEIGFPSSVVSHNFNIWYLPEPTGEILLPAWGEPMATSCVAGADEFFGLASCIYPSNKSLCAAGEADMPMMYPEETTTSIDPEIWNEFPVITFGLVVDTTTKKPIEGAKIEMDPERGRIVYAQLGTDPMGFPKFEPSGADATNASGLFLVYMKEPSVVTVTQGASTKKMRVGGVTGWGSAVIVPLR